jgi:transposase-like protein
MKKTGSLMQLLRQRYHCKACDSDFDDLTNTIFAHPIINRCASESCAFI